MRVLAVDDQPTFIEAAREVTEATEGFCWVGEASSGQEALTVVGRAKPDLVLLDVRMPAMDGIETSRRLTAMYPNVVVVLISVTDVTTISAAAGSSGAVAVLRKEDFGPSVLRGLWTEHGRAVA